MAAAATSEELCELIDSTAKCPKLLKVAVKLVMFICSAIVITGGIGVTAYLAAGEAMTEAKSAKEKSVEAMERTQHQYEALRAEMTTLIELLRGGR